jgi:predicted unusual protein kinase regulating ubiquinone biosynthesis (AarF/ABC1/UbiB family)
LRLAQLLISMAQLRTTSQQRIETIMSDQVMAALHNFPVMLPRDLVYFARTAALIEGVGMRYDPYFNGMAVGTPLVLRLRARIMGSLGESAAPSIEDLAAMAGWAVGSAWRQLRAIVQSVRQPPPTSLSLPS